MKYLHDTRILRHDLDLRKAHLAIGPHAVLDECKITVHTELVCSYSTFNRCEFSGDFPDGFYWQGCEFTQCRFRGKLLWHTFGPAEASHGGGLHQCNFGDCLLLSCEFFVESIAEHTLPGWPAFFVREPVANWKQLQNLGWPALETLETWKFGRNAPWVSYNAEELAKVENVDREALKAFAQTCPLIYVARSDP